MNQREGHAKIAFIKTLCQAVLGFYQFFLRFRKQLLLTSEKYEARLEQEL